MVRFGGEKVPFTPDDLFSPARNCCNKQISRTRDTSVLTLIWFRNPANELRLVVYLITYLTFLFTSNRQKSLGVLVAIKSSVRSTVDRHDFPMIDRHRSSLDVLLAPSEWATKPVFNARCVQGEGREVTWRKWGGQLHQNPRYLFV